MGGRKDSLIEKSRKEGIKGKQTMDKHTSRLYMTNIDREQTKQDMTIK